MDLSTRIDEAGLTFRLKGKKLAKLGIETIGDLIYHIPFRYDDFSLTSPISALQEEEIITVKGEVVSAQNVYTRRRFNIQRVVIKDDTGEIECVWFNQSYVVKNLNVGDKLSVTGKVARSGAKKSIQIKDYEVVSNDMTYHTGRLVPIYPETHGLSSKWIRNRVKDILPKLALVDFLPEELKKRNNLLELKEALNVIHYPKNLDEASKARARLSFDELFLSQLGGALRKRDWNEGKKAIPLDVNKYQKQINKLIKSLPFELTSAQKRAVEEIFLDLGKEKPMNRLLQGDVGSGKTIVAATTMYLAHLNGFSSSIMAPTEILANQHYKTIKSLLSPFGVRVALFTSKEKSKGDFDIAIGTHALIGKNVNFKNLGLIIIDEQQKFGVEQRAILREKGSNPHFLTMTATPIPRTVLLTLYGDLDLSVLDEMPFGRKKIKTWLVPKEKRKAAYAWIEKMVKQKDKNGENQVFIICPFIEESESMTTVKAAVKEFEYLKTKVFANLKLGLIHGKIKAKEKEDTLAKFKDGEIDILVATPVVEVGIDIPSATIILIEAADRFGLAQLHQLRGRVGRSEKESYCLLFTESESERVVNRLKFMEKSHVGAELAELDLKLRGPGEVYGTLQHGASEFKIASFSDFSLIELAKDEALKYLDKLSSLPALQEKIKSTIIQRVSPD